MKKTPYTRGRLQVELVATIPFFVGVVMLIVNLATITNQSLLPSFNLNFLVVFLFAFLHFSLIIILIKWKKIDVGFAKLNTIKKIGTAIGVPLVIFLSSFLLVMSFKMNFNYWLRSDTIQIIELTVKDKHISTGRVTDYYIDFSSKYGDYSYKVSSKKYNYYGIGEKINTTVNKGYFEGYFLTEKIK